MSHEDYGPEQEEFDMDYAAANHADECQRRRAEDDRNPVAAWYFRQLDRLYADYGRPAVRRHFARIEQALAIRHSKLDQEFLIAA